MHRNENESKDSSLASGKGGKDKEGPKKDGAEGGARPSIDIPAISNGNGNLDAEAAAALGSTSVPPTPGGEGGLDPIAKKVRNLSKKVRVCVSLRRRRVGLEGG